MPDKDKNTKLQEKNKVTFSKIFRKICKYFLRVSIVLLILVFLAATGLILLSKTYAFRNWAGGILGQTINESLTGTIEFDDFRINWLDGIELYGFRLLAAGDTVAAAERISVSLDIPALMDEKANINIVKLESPIIKMLRLSDSSWNIDHIAPPSEDTTESGTSEWVIELNKLIIDNGKFIMVDSLSENTAKGSFDQGNIIIKNLNLNAGLKAELKDNKYKFDLRKLSFKENNSDLVLENLSMQLAADTNGITIGGLELETADSELKLEAALGSINLFAEESEPLENADVKLSIDFEKIYTGDILKFAKLPVKKDTYISLESDLNGTLRQISIEKFLLKSGNSRIKFSGNIDNADDERLLSFDINLAGTKFYESDIGRILGNTLSEGIPAFGIASFRNGRFHGTADSISTEIEFFSGLGGLSGRGGIALGETPAYSAELSCQNLNLGLLAGSADMQSSITGDIFLQGSGTDPQHMNSVFSIRSVDSRFSMLEYNALLLQGSLIKGIVRLDTLALDIKLDETKRPEYLSGEKTGVEGWAEVDISNPNDPSYKVNLDYFGLDLAQMFHEPGYPQYLTGAVDINASGIELDQLDGNFQLAFEEVLFGDRALFPFSLNLNFRHFESGRKTVNIYSDYITAELYGNFKYFELIDALALNGEFIGQYFADKFSNPETATDSSLTVDKAPKFIPVPGIIDFSLKANINDISAIATLVDDFSIVLKSQMEFHFKSDSLGSSFDIDSLNISSFDLETPDVNISARPIDISGGFEIIKHPDSSMSLQKIGLQLSSNFDIMVNDLVIANPIAGVNIENNKVGYNASTVIDNMIAIESTGQAEFMPEGIELETDSLTLGYMELFQWANYGPIIASYNEGNINIGSLAMQREGAEKIELKGSLQENNAANLSLKLSNFPIGDILLLIDKEQIPGLDTLSGNIDSLKANLSGSLENPFAILTLDVGNLALNNIPIGEIKAALKHKNARVKGLVDLFDPFSGEKRKLLTAEIASLPLDLSTSPKGERFHNRFPLDIDLKADDLPLVLANPFIVGIKDLRGSADFKINIKGFAPDNIDYIGNLNFDKASMIVESTNLKYYADADVEVITDEIKLRDITLYNTDSDMKRGAANLTGLVRLNNFNLDYLDFEIRSNGFKVLSSASRKTMPTLYGDFIIATGENPLKFFGTMTEPNLEGDVNVLLADLNMPLESEPQKVQSSLAYKIKGSQISLYDTTETAIAVLDSIESRAERITNRKDNENGGQEQDFADLLNINIRARLLGSFNVTMDLMPLSKLTADIGTQNRGEQIRYVKYRNSKQANLYGELLVEKGSTLSLYKTFNTQGTISFPSGNIANPGLDLVAEHEFTSQSGEETKYYIVRLNVSGTKENLQIDFSYSINGEDVSGDSTQIAQDAMFLLLFGKTKAELTGGSGSGGPSGLENIGTSGAAMGASFVVNEILSSIEYIESADIDFEGGDFTNARLKLKGKLFGDVRFEIGGTVADFASNNEISIDAPLAELFGSDLMNINLTISRSTSINTTPSIDQKEWEVKFKFGGSW